ncbi:V-type proton ATPase subunit G 1 [Cricetulus griseus]|uniref:V-type proton ATPase subunit G 1 n=1 Tax=Cricetulus griseus TaxID=10029 RepID=G3HUG6_CRIGR|nr:V-type proton ATPase subunit G 1 [Cricetulus griseus]
MASQSQGIQELLQAEKVSEALKRKKWRLKQAKEEAQAEIQNRDEVLDNLLAFVCDIRPEIHENYRING